MYSHITKRPHLHFTCRTPLPAPTTRVEWRFFAEDNQKVGLQQQSARIYILGRICKEVKRTISITLKYTVFYVVALKK